MHAALVHGRPLLLRAPSSHITYTVRDCSLRHSYRHDEHTRHSLGTAAPRDITALYGVQLDESSAPQIDKDFPMHYGRPFSWHFVAEGERKKALGTSQQVLLRFALEDMLLRVTVPPGGRFYYQKAVRTRENFPYNAWTFFRFLAHLEDMGFDKHELFRATTDLLGNQGLHNSRGLKDYDENGLRGGELETIWLDMQPWEAEMTTQACLWQGLLGFTVVQEPLLPSQIHRYGVKIPTGTTKTFREERPEHILVFLRRVFAFAKKDLRKMLLGQVGREERDLAHAVRTEHCVIVTAWEWDELEEQGTFWMRDNVMEDIQGDYPPWDVFVYATDVWNEPVLERRRPEIVQLEQWGDKSLL